MAIPDYQSCMRPLLEFISDEQVHKMSEAIKYVSDVFMLGEEEKKAVLPSGTQYVINNRVGWAKTYLSKAGLISSKRRGYFNITDLGKNFLRNHKGAISVKDLEQYQEFKEFKQKSTIIDKQAKEEPPSSINKTPEEALEYGYQKISESLESDLLMKIMECSSTFFEHLVVELLVKMGYGGSYKEAASIVGKSGDEGIDGIIKEDRLGLDSIYIQAKRWEGNISRPEIQKFAGALLGKKARKGIFITTSSFTKEALRYASSLEQKIVLIDGKRLTELMIENGLGVSTVLTYEIKKIDLDYFEDFT